MGHGKNPSPPHTARMPSRLAGLARVWISLLLGGCASTELVLYKVARADPKQAHTYVEATPEEARQGLQVSRGGQQIGVAVPMPLAMGDVIETLPNTVAVIRFPDGHEATLLPANQVQLGSLWARFGEIFVRVFKQAQDTTFKVKTAYVTAGVVGTEFWVRVGRHDASVELGVVEGRVSLASNAGLWTPVGVLRKEVATVLRDAPPSKAARQRASVDAIVQWMRGGLLPLSPPPLPHK